MRDISRVPNVFCFFCDGFEYIYQHSAHMLRLSALPRGRTWLREEPLPVRVDSQPTGRFMAFFFGFMKPGNRCESHVFFTISDRNSASSEPGAATNL